MAELKVPLSTIHLHGFTIPPRVHAFVLTLMEPPTNSLRPWHVCSRSIAATFIALWMLTKLSETHQPIMTQIYRSFVDPY